MQIETVELSSIPQGGDVRASTTSSDQVPGEGGVTDASIDETIINNDAIAEYYTPRSLLDAPAVFQWHDERPAGENYCALGKSLNEAGSLYRNGSHGESLIQIPADDSVPPKVIAAACALAAIIADRIHVKIMKKGEAKGNRVPSGHLASMLASESFLQQFKPIEIITTCPIYLPDFRLTVPGFNSGGVNHRIFYRGPEPLISNSMDIIWRFLDQMDFASNADRTNAVGLALTRILRNRFVSGKPIGLITATKSHAGKDTIAMFVSGFTRMISVSYQAADWALERSIIGAIKTHPDVGVINVENARLGRGGEYISSAFLERTVTAEDLFLFSTGTGSPIQRKNDLLFVITTNHGALGGDLHNRSIPIHLAPTGDIERRESKIGNPKLEFLPAHIDKIEAELRGMIKRWKDAGQPLDKTVKHPFTPWARTVGGILKVSGFTDFLENYHERKVIDDPIRHALGLLGAAYVVNTHDDKWAAFNEDADGGWETPAYWADLAREIGVVEQLVTAGDRRSDKGRERGVGRTLTHHRDETFKAETGAHRLTLKLEKARRRWPGTDGKPESNNPSTKYRFAIVDYKIIPADDDKE